MKPMYILQNIVSVSVILFYSDIFFVLFMAVSLLNLCIEWWED